jgi:hypothetical protein
LLVDVNKLSVFKRLLTMPTNVLPLHLKQTFPPIVWIFHWRWRWWDQLQATFLNLFYFKIGSNRKKKELQCKFCDKKYSSDQSLKEHVLRDHEKRTPYQCQHCTRSFGIRMKLKSHIQNVHERVKCNECGQEMCNTFILKRHKAKVHGVMPTNVHQCKNCPMFFSGKGSLKNHLTKIHPEIKI